MRRGREWKREKDRNGEDRRREGRERERERERERSTEWHDCFVNDCTWLTEKANACAVPQVLPW